MDDWERTGSEGTRKAVKVSMEGQDHTSPPLTLATDRQNEEAWDISLGPESTPLGKSSTRACLNLSLGQKSMPI